MKKSSKVGAYKGEPSGRGDPAVGILCLGGPSGQGTEGYLRTAGAAADFVMLEKVVAMVKKWG